jgi:hypothetical protein
MSRRLESLLLAGLALGTRLSAGVPISEASWQLAPSDLTGVYVYAPKDFTGIMNTAVNLLSANQRLIESRALRLEWVVKSNSSPPTMQFESEVVNSPTVRPTSQPSLPWPSATAIAVISRHPSVVGGARSLDSHEANCNHCQCRGCQDQ